MAFTYTGSSSTTFPDRDKVRLLSGNISSADDQILHDTEITYALGEYSNVYEAAALGCELLASKYSANPSQESVGQLGLTWGDRAEQYRTQAAELRKLALRKRGVSPYAGGISISDKDVDHKDSDRVPMAFRIGMNDNPVVSDQNPSTAN
jgi:hypothetical protein